MKKLTVLVAVAISAMVIAQPPKKVKPEHSEQKVEKGIEGKQDEKEKPGKKDIIKPNQKLDPKEQIGQGKNDQKGKPDKDKGNGKGNSKGSGKSDENPGKGNAYGQNKGDLSGREFGQQRAAEARAKHEASQPKTETQARELIRTTIERNNVLLDVTSKKINDIKGTLDELKKAGKITATEVEEKIKLIESIEKRRAAIESAIKN
jgi:hypothetical protein